ncbi:DUF2066 domain-containing protein [Paraferrimonas sp. SM1919]|uniref:DUF2066 domain-containing protein n=1 Tax=Paraferrimonas sp. SM1919 TaxID=2662263 RepID=UPI0013D237D3|nr:DUF2066 domain-containing protein [Paraferrimonas sp. SM1919]
MSCNLFAVEVQRLNQTQIDVPDRSRAELNKAIELGMQNIILKISTEESLAHPLVQARVKVANQFLRKYSYEQGSGLILELEYDLDAIEKVLRTAQLPVWGKQRPMTLVWLNDQTTDSIISESNLTQSELPLASIADKLGLPGILPTMDLDDLSQVNANDIKGWFIANIATASKRYPTDFFVVANLSRRAGFFELEMQLFNSTVQEASFYQPIFSRKSQLDDKNQSASKLVNWLKDFYINRYARVSTDGQQSLLLTLNNIDGIEALTAAEKHISSMSQVKAIQINQVNHHGVELMVELYTTEADFLNALKLDPKIESLLQEQQQTYEHQYIWRN